MGVSTRRNPLWSGDFDPDDFGARTQEVILVGVLRYRPRQTTAPTIQCMFRVAQLPGSQQPVRQIYGSTRFEFVVIPCDEVLSIYVSIGVEVACGPLVHWPEFVDVPDDEVPSIHHAIQRRVTQEIRFTWTEIDFPGCRQPVVAIGQVDATVTRQIKSQSVRPGSNLGHQGIDVLIVVQAIVVEIRAGDDGLPFKGSYVDDQVVSSHEMRSPLIEFWRRMELKVTRINGGAAEHQGMGARRTSVVRECAQQWVLV